MTYKDIKTKYLIEYDKADITSSYPSQTDYEIATILDKAYLAIIAQKLTGNNPRKVGFEADNKAIEDVRPLITRRQLQLSTDSTYCINEYSCDIPVSEFLYYIQGLLNSKESGKSIIGKVPTQQNVELVSHEDAEKFKATTTNLPWIHTPVCFIEDNKIHILVDCRKYRDITSLTNFDLTYIKKPISFINNDQPRFDDTQFELTDTMAEELINLAIMLSTEIVESQRQQTKTAFRPLES